MGEWAGCSKIKPQFGIEVCGSEGGVACTKELNDIWFYSVRFIL